MGIKECVQVCSPLYISLHPNTKPRERHIKDKWHTPACWGINEIPGAVVAFTSLPQETHQCTKDGGTKARRLTTQSGWLHTWSGEGTKTHYWCCNGLLFFPRGIMDILCMAYHPIPTTWQHPKRWTKTGTWGLLHQPCLQYLHRDQQSSFGGTSVEAVMNYLKTRACADNSAHHAHKISVSRPNGKGGMTPPRHNPSKRRPHRRGEQMYDHKRKGSGQIQGVLPCSRTTWWCLPWRT